MTLALSAASPAVVGGSVNSPVTTASFTAPANALLVARVAYNGPAGAGVDHTVTDSSDLTWTLRGRKSLSSDSLGGVGRPGGVEVWTAVTGSSSVTMTVSTAFAGGSSKHTALKVEAWTDTAGSVPTFGAISSASSSNGLPSITLSTTKAGSRLGAASSDWAQKGAATAASGQTVTGEDNVNGQYSAHFWHTDASAGAYGSSVTMALSAPAGQDFNMLAYEIKAAGPAENLPPTASAGPNQSSIEPLATVALRGSGTDPDGTIASYTWRQVSGSAVTLSSTNVASPTFTAPGLPAAGDLVFGLIVKDNSGASSPESTVMVSVLPATEFTAKSGAWSAILTKHSW